MSVPRVELPYCSWGAVEDWFIHLGNLRHVPARIDRSVFPEKCSMGTREQVLHGLRCLNLVSKNAPTNGLTAVCAKGKEGWRETLNVAYADFFKVGWTGMTPLQFKQLLAKHGAVQEETRKRAARFVLRALLYCDIPYSALLDDLGPRGTSATKPMARAKTSVRTVRAPETSGPTQMCILELDGGDASVRLYQSASDRDLALLRGFIGLQQAWKKRAS